MVDAAEVRAPERRPVEVDVREHGARQVDHLEARAEHPALPELRRRPARGPRRPRPPRPGPSPSGGSSPTRPSTASLSRSACPVWRPYSSSRSKSSRRRLATTPLVRAERAPAGPRPPSAERGGVPRPGPLDRAVVQRVEEGRVVVGRRSSTRGRARPRPASTSRARRAVRPDSLVEDVDLLDQGEVLEQAAEGHRRGADRGGQPGPAPSVGLPPERRPLAVEGTEQVLDLGAVERRFPGRRGIGLGHGSNLGRTDRPPGRLR